MSAKSREITSILYNQSNSLFGLYEVSNSLHIYPIWFCLNPISASGLVQSEPDEATLGDSRRFGPLSKEEAEEENEQAQIQEAEEVSSKTDLDSLGEN